MAIICPKCGREFMGQRDMCPVCKCPTVNDSGIDNSETARQERLRSLKSGNNVQQVEIQEVQIQDFENKGAKPSTLSVLALVFALLGCTSFIGTILAIIDLCIKDGKKKVCSIIALVITCLWCMIIVIAVLSDNDKPQVVRNSVGSSVSEQQSQRSYVEGDTSSKDTFGLMEAAEMNNVRVIMTNYSENYGSEWNKPTDGNVFLLVEFEIANNSSSELAISSIMSFDGYVDGYSVSTSFGALLENEQSQLDGTVASGMKMKGWIGYEVPNGWREMEIHFTDNIWNNNKFKFLIEK